MKMKRFYVECFWDSRYNYEDLTEDVIFAHLRKNIVDDIKICVMTINKKEVEK